MKPSMMKCIQYGNLGMYRYTILHLHHLSRSGVNSFTVGERLFLSRPVSISAIFIGRIVDVIVAAALFFLHCKYKPTLLQQ